MTGCANNLYLLYMNFAFDFITGNTQKSYHMEKNVKLTIIYYKFETITI